MLLWGCMETNSLVLLAQIIVFLYSVILHEIAHGFVANKFGDDTAKVSGRLSLNPLVHIDPVGSLLVPFILYISGSGFLFGWAKPVPVNPFRLRAGVISYRWVAMAGVLTNFVLALFAAGILKVAISVFGFGADNLGVIFFILVFQINLILAVFNALPLPGFDGFNFLTTFKWFSGLLARSPLANPIFMAQYGLVVSIVIIYLFMPFISKIIGFVFSLVARIFGL